VLWLMIDPETPLEIPETEDPAARRAASAESAQA